MRRNLWMLVLASAPLWAGKRIVAEITDLNTKAVSTSETVFDGSRLHHEAGGVVTMFLTQDGDRMLTLSKVRQEYFVIDQRTLDQIKAEIKSMYADVRGSLELALPTLEPEQRADLAKTLREMDDPFGPLPITFTDTGPAKVNDVPCVTYEGVYRDRKVLEVCVASYESVHLTAADWALQKKLDQFASAFFGEKRAIASSMPEGVEGLPVRLILFENGTATQRQVLKSIGEAILTDDDFALEGAKKVDPPGVVPR